MEETESLFRRLKKLRQLGERYREIREMLGVFKRFKVVGVYEVCVLPKDASLGEEQRLLLEIEIKCRAFRSLDEPLRIAKVALKVPKSKRTFLLWDIVSDDRPCKWKEWREFPALIPYEVNKHSVGMGCDEYVYEENKFFPRKTGEVKVIAPGEEWEATFVFELRFRSPYNKPVKLCFYDDYGELIDCRVIFLD